jgi:hypothetical protein
MLLKILLVVVALYFIFVISVRWLFPWLVQLYIKRTLKKLNKNFEENLNSKKSYRQNSTIHQSDKKYEDIEYIDYEEIKDNT